MQLQHGTVARRAKRYLIEMAKNKEIYLLILPVLAWYFIFCYLPMGGLVLAFKSFKGKLGIWGSPWNGLDNWRLLFKDHIFIQSIWTTLRINLVELVVCFPIPVILALMIDELRMTRYKRVLQTALTFPHFLSWVIIASIMKGVFQADGVINGILSNLGSGKILFLGDKSLFRPLIYSTNVWKEAGWSSIIYLAAITGIDQEQYEAAEIDGASRFQRIMHVSLPEILPTVAILLVLQVGGMMNGHFDQIFNLQNDVVRDTAETLNLYIYRVTFERMPNYGFSTAVSLLCSVVNSILLISANAVSTRIGGVGLMGGANNR